MSDEPLARPPPPLVIAVALVAAAMLFTEILLTRLFSVLFYYHYSFFAVSVVMSGLALGGVLAGQLHRRATGNPMTRLAALALAYSLLTIVALANILFSEAVAPFWNKGDTEELSLTLVILTSLAFLPGLVAAGAFLATAFAIRESWIGRLYASDLVAAACACVGAVFMMRWMPGPVAMFVPITMALGAAVLLGRSSRAVMAASLVAAAALLAVDTKLNPDDDQPAPFLWERWNEHSRIVVRNDGVIVIDRSAATFPCHTPPVLPEGRIPLTKPRNMEDIHAAYALGRPLDEVAIIGVGGGSDVLAALRHGARHVDGFELNALILGLLQTWYSEVCAIASYPEVSLHHQEGRIGVVTGGKKYDVIQASLIDTWAATAGGGFVLSENALYTLEAWHSFLGALRDRGVLTMSRWWLPATPAELQRMVALAAVALQGHGVVNAKEHILVVTKKDAPDVAAAPQKTVTIVVSRAPFAASEVTALQGTLDAHGLQLLTAPNVASVDPVLDQLMDHTTREQAITSSPYNLSVPTDERPYFFLQLRLRDIPGLFRERYGSLLELTFEGVRLLVVLGACSLLFSLLVLYLGLRGVPSSRVAPLEQRVGVLMSIYALLIGLGYMLVQLGLHSRLIILLGHPSLSLSVVLCALLLGSGVGSALSTRAASERAFLAAWGAIVLVLLGVVAALTLLPQVGLIASLPTRVMIVGGLCFVVGIPMGFAFPLGIRIVSGIGTAAVQRMWAINGAASIAGTVLAANVALAWGSRAVVLLGVVCYVAVLVLGLTALRTRPVQGVSR